MSFAGSTVERGGGGGGVRRRSSSELSLPAVDGGRGEQEAELR